MLTNEQRIVFIQYLHDEIENTRLLREQVEKLGISAMVEVYRKKINAYAVVLNDLVIAEKQTIS